MENLYKKLLNNQWHSLGKCLDCDFLIVEQFYSITLPKEYKQLIKLTNGGEREFEKTYFELWKLESILEGNQNYQIQKHLHPKIICFANDGDLAWVFDFRKSATQPVISIVPLGDLSIESIKIMAKNFIDFITKLVNEQIDTYS